MKYLIILLFIYCSLSAQIVVNYDKFEDFTTIKSDKPLTLKNNFYFIPFWNCKGHDTCKTENLFIQVGSRSDTWKFKENQDFKIVADTNRITPIYQNNHEGKVEDGLVNEYMTYTISAQDFLNLADAITVDCRINNIDFSMSYEERVIFRRLIPYLKK